MLINDKVLQVHIHLIAEQRLHSVKTNEPLNTKATTSPHGLPACRSTRTVCTITGICPYRSTNHVCHSMGIDIMLIREVKQWGHQHQEDPAGGAWT